MRASTRSEPDCTGTCSCGATASHSAIAGAEQLGEAAIAVGPDQQVDVRGALAQALAEVLRHAARYPEPHVGAAPLVARELAEPADDALLGVLADGAGVQEDHVGPIGAGGLPVAVRREMAEHQLGVGDVHLAAVGLDVDGRHATRSISGAAPAVQPARGTIAGVRPAR